MTTSNVLRPGLAACLALSLACTASDAEDGSASATGDESSAGPTTDGPTGTSTGPSTTAGTETADSSGSSSTGGSSDGSSGGADSSTGEIVCGDPVELGAFTPSDGNARGFEVVGNTVYLAAESGGLAIVDITDPGAAVEVAILDLGPGLLVQRVAAGGDTVYVGLRGAGWAAIDVTDPAMPQMVFHEPDVAGQDLAFADDVLYVADVNGVQVFNVSDPAMPQALVTDLVLPGSTQSVALSGDFAYATGLAAGLSVLDISAPEGTFEVTTLDMDGRGYLAVQGDRAFVSAEDGVHIVDVTDPTTPVELGVFAADRVHALAADDRLWVLGDDTQTVAVPLLRVVDYADGAAAVELFNGLDDYASPAWIEVSEGRVLFSEEDDDALHVLDGCP
jgi:LVIVD repeat